MEIKSIIKAFKAVWDNHPTLKDIPLRSTRITTGTLPFYALVSVKHGGNTFDSGRTLGRYILNVQVFGDVSLANLEAISDILVNEWDFVYNVVLPDANLILVLPDFEVPELDKDDLYGTDVRILSQQWILKTDEFKH